MTYAFKTFIISTGQLETCLHITDLALPLYQFGMNISCQTINYRRNIPKFPSIHLLSVCLMPTLIRISYFQLCLITYELLCRLKKKKRHPQRTFHMLSTNLEGTYASFTLVPLLF